MLEGFQNNVLNRPTDVTADSNTHVPAVSTNIYRPERRCKDLVVSDDACKAGRKDVEKSCLSIRTCGWMQRVGQVSMSMSMSISYASPGLFDL